jgi:AhpD family alkylhydroperoxidase
MPARMKHPLMIVPGAMQAAIALGEAVRKTALPEKTRSLIHLRVSQINGCSHCVDMASRELRKAGDTEQRIATVAAWRDAPWFDDAERAALALSEAATRLSDRADAVPDAVWEQAARHLDEASMAAVLTQVGVVSLWNHINVPIRQGPAPGE